ncbi:MAG: iron ABC transporter permease [Tumebacillaceae bacterium]
MNKHQAFRLGRLSFLLDRRSALIFLILLALTFVTVLVSAGMGQMQIHPLNVLNVLIGQGTPQDALIVTSFRLPRIVAGLLVGMSLAVSGAILQSIIRNPLASPDVIGITGGASVAAVVFITMFETASIQWLPFAALVGAAAITLLIYALAYKSGVTPMRLVLVGVGINAAATAVTTLLIVMSPIYLTQKAFVWLTGSVYGSTWGSVQTMLPWVVLFIPLAIGLSRNINIQQLGDDLATGVGHPVQRQRFLLLLICVALAGVAVAIGGAIGFVGLLAPHIARKLVGPLSGSLLPASALVGGLLVILADLLARMAMPPLDLPVGIFTAAIGAPFFIYLLYKNRNK